MFDVLIKLISFFKYRNNTYTSQAMLKVVHQIRTGVRFRRDKSDSTGGDVDERTPLNSVSLINVSLFGVGLLKSHSIGHTATFLLLLVKEDP